MPYYIGDLNGDPILEKYPYVYTQKLFQRAGMVVVGFIDVV